MRILIQGIGLVVLLAFAASVVQAQPVPRSIRTPEYRQLQEKLCSGWNTWYNNSMLSHVHLPEGFAVNVCFKSYGGYLRETFKVSKQYNRPEELIPGLRSDDGFYTSIVVQYEKCRVRVESAADGEDLLLLITPEEIGGYLKFVIEAGVPWNRDGSVSREGEQLAGRCGGREFRLGATAAAEEDGYVMTTAPALVFSADRPLGVYSGRPRSMEEIVTLMAARRAEQLARVRQYGELADAFQAMQTILAWNTIYDAPNNRVITPVSRWWNAAWWGGFVLFDWDTYFASYMFSLFNKELAYANAIEITKAITPQGFIPNYLAAGNNGSWDRSQPPVGSFIINEIYKKYREQWLLDETYAELLSWNRWWVKNRSIKGYLAWGSSVVEDKNYQGGTDFLGAILESGLDNSPMYDDIPFNEVTRTMELADVGLMSFYINDCKSLAEIAAVLGKKEDVRELEGRARQFSDLLKTMWDEKAGIYFNRRTDTGQFNRKLSPTNFYPLLAGVPTQKQAERMIRDHYFNPSEFHGEFVLPSIAKDVPGYKDNAYWRGRIWAPMNFLVYMGLRRYNLPEARADLLDRSYQLLMKSWRVNGAIYENYNSETGEGDDVRSADSFYHWGALLTFLSFIEKGYMGPP